MLSIKIAFDSEKQNQKLTITPTLPFSQARLHSQPFHLSSSRRPAEGGKRAEVSRQPLLSDIPSSSLFLLLQRGVPLTDRSACREHHSPARPGCSQVPRLLHRRSTAELSPRFSARWAFPPQAFPPPGCGAAGGRGDTGAALRECQRPGPPGRRRGRRVRAQLEGAGAGGQFPAQPRAVRLGRGECAPGAGEALGTRSHLCCGHGVGLSCGDGPRGVSKAADPPAGRICSLLWTKGVYSPPVPRRSSSGHLGHYKIISRTSMCFSPVCAASPTPPHPVRPSDLPV